MRLGKLRIVLAQGGLRHSTQVDRGVHQALLRFGHDVVLVKDSLDGVTGDMLLVIHGRNFPLGELLKFRHGPKVVWLLDEPQESDVSFKYAKMFDVVVTNDQNTRQLHGRNRSLYLPLAANPNEHKPDKSLDASIDVSFVGTLHEQRCALLNEAYKICPDIRWYISGGVHPWCRDVSFGSAWKKGFIDHSKYIDICCASKIVLDIPRDEFVNQENTRRIPASGVSPRVFEAPAMGRFLLTSDARSTIFDLFSKREIGIYSHCDPTSLANAIRYYLEHDEERAKMAMRARLAFLTRHTYCHRVNKLVRFVVNWTQKGDTNGS